MIIAMGCDHAGFPLKAAVTEMLRKRGIEVIDHGCYRGEVVDFPDVAKKVCASVTEKKAQRQLPAIRQRVFERPAVMISIRRTSV